MENDLKKQKKARKMMYFVSRTSTAALRAYAPTLMRSSSYIFGVHVVGFIRASLPTSSLPELVVQRHSSIEKYRTVTCMHFLTPITTAT